jgi:hypothetical protein
LERVADSTAWHVSDKALLAYCGKAATKQEKSSITTK